MSITDDERAEMCDLFHEVGPDAPTLCEGWTTRDLLTHLLVRERRPDAAVAIVTPFLHDHAANVSASVAAQPYEDLISQFRGGPPIWTLWAIPVLGDSANLTEFFVHLEDIRRAQPDWIPRDDNPARDDLFWKRLKMMGRLLFRKSPGGVTLRSAGREDIVVKKGEPGVILVGQPGEIMLIGFGRGFDKAHVVVQGEAADIAAFEQSPRGL